MDSGIWPTAESKHGSQRKLVKLHRSEEHAMIAGVMSGIAEYFGWSPVALRILFVTISIASAAVPGTLIYLLLWLVMPKATEASYSH